MTRTQNLKTNRDRVVSWLACCLILLAATVCAQDYEPNNCFQVTSIKGTYGDADYESDFRKLQLFYSDDMGLRTIRLCGLGGSFQGIMGVIENSKLQLALNLFGARNPCDDWTIPADSYVASITTMFNEARLTYIKIQTETGASFERGFGNSQELSDPHTTYFDRYEPLAGFVAYTHGESYLSALGYYRYKCGPKPSEYEEPVEEADELTEGSIILQEGLTETDDIAEQSVEQLVASNVKGSTADDETSILLVLLLVLIALIAILIPICLFVLYQLRRNKVQDEEWARRRAVEKEMDLEGDFGTNAGGDNTQNPFGVVKPSHRVALDSVEAHEMSDGNIPEKQDDFMAHALAHAQKGCRRGTAKERNTQSKALFPDINENRSQSLWPGQTLSKFYQAVAGDSARDVRRSSTKVKGFGVLEGFDLARGEIPTDKQLQEAMRGKSTASRRALLAAVAKAKDDKLQFEVAMEQERIKNLDAWAHRNVEDKIALQARKDAELKNRKQKTADRQESTTAIDIDNQHSEAQEQLDDLPAAMMQNDGALTFMDTNQAAQDEEVAKIERILTTVEDDRDDEDQNEGDEESGSNVFDLL